MSHTQFTDNLVREYILYRGLANTLKVFDTELKLDKDKSFRTDKIIDFITYSINTHDLQSLRDIWGHLCNHFFNKLEHHFSAAVTKLEQCILKLYLVTAYSSNKQEKINEFFNKLSGELHQQPEWKEWFFFPYCKNPEEHPAFAVCFTKQWQDTLLISLHNFLSTIFQCVPQPTLTKVEIESSIIKKLQEENAILRDKLLTMQNQRAQQYQGSGSNNTSSSHQSRISVFQDQHSRTRNSPRDLNDIKPFDILPPNHLVDDFFIIAQETLNMSNNSESQARGLKSLIKNIGSGGSPVLGRKEGGQLSKRSGSVGSRTWMQNKDQT